MNDLKNCWCEARFRRTPVENPENRRRTALETLAAHYRRFSTVILILAMCMPLWMWNVMRSIGLDVNVAVWLMLFLTLYCLTGSTMDWWLYKGISRIDVATMTVSDVCRRIYYYRKKHFQFMGILIPFAIVAIGIMVWIFSADEWALYGIAAGAVIGLAAGLRQFMKFMSEYRDITD